MSLDFFGPFLKVERAGQHIKQLEGLLNRYVSENRKIFSPKYQERAFKQGRDLRFAEHGRHMPTVLGDAIHNLRASLDHAYCILIQANGHTLTDYSKFPFGGNDWVDIKGSIDGNIRAGNGPSETVRDFIGTEIQPFPRGKHNLWDLHRLDITDKHERILPMGSYAFIANAEITYPDTPGGGLFLKNTTFTNFSRIAGAGAKVILRDHVKNAFDVTFGIGQPLEGMPILDTLQHLQDSVTHCLKGLREFL